MGKASREKREGREVKEDLRVVLWGVLMDGQLGSQLQPTAEAAEKVARALREEHPASILEWCQIGIVVLSRRPLRPKIDVVRAADALEAPEA